LLNEIAIFATGAQCCHEEKRLSWKQNRNMRNPITRNNLVARLLDAVPEFQANPEDVRENLTYLIFNDLARFVSSLIEKGDHE